MLCAGSRTDSSRRVSRWLSGQRSSPSPPARGRADTSSTSILDLPDNAAEQLEITVYGPLFVVILAIVWSLAREERSRIARTLLAGAGLLALAAASELAGIGTRAIGEGDTSWENRARVGLEEAAEVSGWILVACALSAMLCGALFRAGALDSCASNAKDRSVQ